MPFLITGFLIGKELRAYPKNIRKLTRNDEVFVENGSQNRF